ncbi:MFS transporter [Gemmobacter sp.]|uniref:MFS transporter n=1 Tax=Gemmobacter sp. TaxID=1898957 RepID=UPI002AFE513F|nr:MFS transporter [Gemmobacter sp.]
MDDVTEPRPVAWRPVVACVTIVQAAQALIVRTVPLFAIPLTSRAAMPPEAIGQLVSASALGSMIYFLWGPELFRRLDERQQLQAGLALCAVALMACLVPVWGVMLLASFAVGFGYGPAGPSGSTVILGVAPPQHLSTILSIKQAGVPAGGLLAGLVLPVIAVAAGLAPALAVAAGLAVAAAAMLWVWRFPVDRPARPRAGDRLGARLRETLVAPLRSLPLLLRTPLLRRTMVAGVALGITQSVLLAYLPLYLEQHVGWTMAAAGALFGLVQGLGIAGRIAMGWAADRAGSADRTMAWLCLASGATMLAIAALQPGQSAWAVLPVMGAAGMTVISWNGVFLTGLALGAPRAQVAAVTGVGTFVLFTGMVLGPLAMQGLVGLTGGYATGMVLAGAIPLAVGLALLTEPSAQV